MKKSKNKPQIDSGLLGVLMSHLIHQDQLLWSRIQFLTILQGAVLTIGYSFRYHDLCIYILVFGVIFTLAIFALVYKDELDRDVNIELMDEMEKYLLPNKIRKELIKKGHSPPFIRVTGDPPKYLKFVRGRYIIRFVFFFFIALDIAIGIVIIKNPDIIPST